MRQDKRIGVVIPALNERNAIGQVIAAIPAWADEIIVADNGSTDGTGEAAERAGARAIREPERGYGAACLAGLAQLGHCDIVVFLDGDFSDDPREMAALVDPIAEGLCDFVIGSRALGTAEKGALLAHQRFGNWLACRLIKLFYGGAFTDLGPFRAIDARALASLDMRDRAYGWTVEMQIKAAKLGLCTREVPVSYRRRIGVSKISGTLRGSILAGTTILRVIARCARAPAGANAAHR